MGFYKRVHILLKKDWSDCRKKNLFCPNNASETYIFISWRHQKLLLVAICCKIVLFHEINSEDIGISKLKLQLKL